MRQFILGTSKAAITSGTFAAGNIDSNAGKLGFGYYPNGIPTFDGGSNIKDKGFIALIRTAAEGGSVVLPFYNNHLTYKKGIYQAATTFQATLTIPSPDVADVDFTVIAVKKGVKFNERNKWTACVHLKGNETAAEIAGKIVSYFMDGSVPRYGLSVSASGAALTFTAETAGVDWEIIPADDIMGETVTVSARGISAYGDASYVKDLADKAAADAGFEYTYTEPGNLLYPNYPLNPLKGSDNSDVGFTIYTIRFAEPREVKTVDELVYQIIQIALPTGSSAISTLDSALAALVG